MDPFNTNNPYSFPTVKSTPVGNSLGGWLFQPNQQNSSGTLPGTTVINIGNVISLNGNADTITISNPTTSVMQIIMGLLPDGTYGLVISKPGVDVRTVFS